MISFFILFFELACIRWLGSTVMFLTFFTNIVLMACFLGVSVGCLAASRSGSWMNALVPLALLTAGSACGFLWAYNTFSQVMIDVGSQQSPQLIYFGTDARIKDPTKWVVPIEVLAGVFLCSGRPPVHRAGPGDGAAVCGDRQPAAGLHGRYSGQSGGHLGVRPDVGLPRAGLDLVSDRACDWRVRSSRAGVCSTPWRALAVLAVVGLADWPRDALGVPTEVVWSPYYQVRFKPRYLSIDVNNLGIRGCCRSTVRGQPISCRTCSIAMREASRLKMC